MNQLHHLIGSHRVWWVKFHHLILWCTKRSHACTSWLESLLNSDASAVCMLQQITVNVREEKNCIHSTLENSDIPNLEAIVFNSKRLLINLNLQFWLCNFLPKLTKFLHFWNILMHRAIRIIYSDSLIVRWWWWWWWTHWAEAEFFFYLYAILTDPSRLSVLSLVSLQFNGWVDSKLSPLGLQAIVGTSSGTCAPATSADCDDEWKPSGSMEELLVLVY